MPAIIMSNRPASKADYGTADWSWETTNEDGKTYWEYAYFSESGEEAAKEAARAIGDKIVMPEKRT